MESGITDLKINNCCGLSNREAYAIAGKYSMTKMGSVKKKLEQLIVPSIFSIFSFSFFNNISGRYLTRLLLKPKLLTCPMEVAATTNDQTPSNSLPKFLLINEYMMNWHKAIVIFNPNNQTIFLFIFEIAPSLTVRSFFII